LANGDDFLAALHLAAAGNGKLNPRGRGIHPQRTLKSIPNEHNKEEGYWASFGTDSKAGQPITTCEWIDRLALNRAEVAIVTGLDLATAVEFDWETAYNNIQVVRPECPFSSCPPSLVKGCRHSWIFSLRA
jgi:hypothetical protein